MKPGRRHIAAAVAALFPAVMAAGSGHAAARHTVRIQDIDFHPSTLVVHRGDEVAWRFLDTDVSHNVTSVGRTRFRGSGSRMTGTYSVHFTRKGTYRYVCTIHANMRGRIVVR